MGAHLISIVTFLAVMGDNLDTVRSCGVKAVFSSLCVLGFDASVDDVEHAFGETPLKGSVSLADIQRAAESLKMHTVLVRLRVPDELVLGSILHFKADEGHFVTFLGFEGEDIVVVDAPMPPLRYNRHLFLEQWSGNALFVFRSQLEKEAYQHDVLTNRVRYFLCFAWIGMFLCVWLLSLLRSRRCS